MTLLKLKNEMAKKVYGMTKYEAISKDICIDCKQKARFYSEAGKKEYQISGLCEYCFDRIFQD